MWIVPNQLMTDVITDEDQRLDLIKDNLMVWGEFASIRAWKNRKWNEFFQIKSDNDSFNREYTKDIKGGLKHDSLEIEENTQDKYEDLPLLTLSSSSYGVYHFVSVDMWEIELSKESSDLVNLLPLVNKYWPTPIARDHYDFHLSSPMSKNEKLGLSKEARNMMSLPRCIYWLCEGYKTHELNPRWTEQMMGLPVGWTDPYL